MKPNNFSVRTSFADTDVVPFLKDLGGGAWGDSNITVALFATEMRTRLLAQSALTYAATVDLDFTGNSYRTLALTGNVTFTSSNRAAGRTVTVKIAADASARTLTFPAGWKFVGSKPTDIAASKTGILTVTCFGSADTDAVAAYAVEE